jgi:hypothetical protein
MIPFSRPDRSEIEPLGTKIYLLWAGVSIGVAFLATPAKFLAPSLALPVALDVGRHTFRVYNNVELALFALLLILGLWAQRRWRWYLGALVAGAIVLAQALWLIPALDLRVLALQADATPLPPSNMHTVYVALEALKVLWLLTMGFGGLIAGGDGHRAVRVRRPGAKRTIQAPWRA